MDKKKKRPKAKRKSPPKAKEAVSPVPELEHEFYVDKAITSIENKVLVFRFGKPETKRCILIDKVIDKVAERVSLFCEFFRVNTLKVTGFNEMYELFDDDFALLFFFNTKHFKIDSGTGDNNKINFLVDKTELIDIIELVYRTGMKGKGRIDNIYSHSIKEIE